MLNARSCKIKKATFKQSLYPVCLLFGLSFHAAVSAKPIRLPETYPIAMTFRAFDNLKLGSDAFKKRLDENEPYALIHAVRPDEAAQTIHQRWPDKILTLQDAYGGIPIKDYDKVWPGHLLFKPGTLSTQNISPQDTTISVQDTGLIAKNNRRLQKISQKNPVSLIIYALDKDGKPDWSQAEHIIVEAIDGQKLMVKRGQWGSRPLAFTAGKAVIAPHMMFWSRQWQLNFSLHSPKGGTDNLTAAEWFARHIANRLAHSDADGIEFDVGRWTWGYPQEHPMDIDNDRTADYGYIDGVNSFGLGGQVFFRELRKLVGPDKIIQVDSNDALSGVRGWQYLNGVQLEAFPAANHFDRFSTAFLHLRMWVENASGLPHISYPFTKTPTTVYANARDSDGSKTDSRFRIGLAAACLTGMPHPFASLKNLKFDPANAKNNAEEDNGKDFGIFDWDEYHAGVRNDWHWLGHPLAAAQQDLSDLGKEDLLAGNQWQWLVDNGFTAKQNSQAAITVEHIPANILPEHMWYGVRYEPKLGGLKTLAQGRQYTVMFDAKGDDDWHYAGQTFAQVPRMLVISGGMAANKSNAPLSVLIGPKPRTYLVSFVADGKSALAFGVAEQLGATELSHIKLHTGGAERWSREFEKGLVLLNMTQNPWLVTVKKDTYQHLKGIQATETNNGQAVDGEVLVPPQDAVFLVKRQGLPD
ncbi:MAG: hypothetical protein PHU14_02345 [Methylovulum sp.]|nr:hypothetical protein [Methylovulum sp.]